MVILLSLYLFNLLFQGIDLILESFLQIHIFLVILLFFLPLHNLYMLYTQKNFVQLAKRIRFFAPLNHSFIAGVIFSGVVIAFYNHDFFSIRQLFMYLIAIYLIVSEVKRYKKIRVISSKDIELQEEFIKFAKIKYSLDVAILLISTLIFL